MNQDEYIEIKELAKKHISDKSKNDIIMDFDSFYYFYFDIKTPLYQMYFWFEDIMPKWLYNATLLKFSKWYRYKGAKNGK